MYGLTHSEAVEAAIKGQKRVADIYARAREKFPHPGSKLIQALAMRAWAREQKFLQRYVNAPEGHNDHGQTR